MGLRLQIVTRHPIVAEHLVRLLSSSDVGSLLTKPPALDFNSIPEKILPCLFVVDTLHLPRNLAELVRLLRVRSPGSKFLALLEQQNYSDEEILRLLHLGVDGVVKISSDMDELLPKAIQALLVGEIWAPPVALAQYVRQTNLLRNPDFLSSFSLTPRESQVLQLMLRRLANKEIASILKISERTVKFHVSRIFAKLHVPDRSCLLTMLQTASA